MRPIALALAALLLVACGSASSPGPDAATDTATDTATVSDAVTTPDAASDAAPDTDAVTTPDAAADTATAPDTAAPPPIRIPGLSAPVTRTTDPNGIVRLSCRTDADCVAALGYVQASRRFFRMDLSRRAARGTVATLYGSYGVENDVTMRGYLATPEGVPLEEATWAALQPETQALFAAYAAGVNAWLRDLRAGANGATPNEEYHYRALFGDVLPDDVLATIPDWDPLDSAAIWVSLLQGNGDNALETTFVPTAGAFDPDTWRDLFAPWPLPDSDNAALMGPDAAADRGAAKAVAAATARPIARPSAAIVAGIADHAAALDRARAPLSVPIGSNSWAAGPAVTGGPALFASDPHGTLANPPYADLYVLDAVTEGEGTLQVGGVFMAGQPIPPIGWNAHVAWGCTVSYVDTTDYWLETLSEDGAGVVFRDGVVPFVTRTDTIEVAGQAPQTVTHRWVPHHGPVLTIDEASGTAVTRRWTGHVATPDLEAYLALLRAGDLDAALAALERTEAFGCNAVLVDDAGRTAWHVTARVPGRPWASPERAPWLVLPGDGSAEWDGFVPLADHPRVVDPPGGAVISANNAFSRAWADGDPTNDGRPYRQVYLSPGYRSQRIGAVLRGGGGAHDAAATHALQGDTLSVHGRDTVPHYLAAAAAAPDPLDAATQALVAALATWDHTCPTGLAGPTPDAPAAADPDVAREAIGCAAFHATMVHTTGAAFRDEYEAVGAGDWFTVGGTEHVLHRALAYPEALVTGDALWDDQGTPDVVETRDEILRAGLAAAAADLVARLGPDPEGWRWGRLHTLTLRATFAVDEWALGPYAAPGAHISVNPGPFVHERDGYAFAHGPAMRLVVAWDGDGEGDGDGPAARYQLPGGLDLHRDSPFYANLIERWLANDPVPVPFSRAAAAATAIDRGVFSP